MMYKYLACLILFATSVCGWGCRANSDSATAHSYLPSGLDTNALAKHFEGTWLTQYEWAAGPIGEIEISENVYVFTLEPTVNRHGKYKSYRRRYVKGSGEAKEFTSGEFGDWQLFAATFGGIAAKDKGWYSATLNTTGKSSTADDIFADYDTLSYALTRIDGQRYVSDPERMGVTQTFVKVEASTLKLPRHESDKQAKRELPTKPSRGEIRAVRSKTRPMVAKDGATSSMMRPVPQMTFDDPGPPDNKELLNDGSPGGPGYGSPGGPGSLGGETGKPFDRSPRPENRVSPPRPGSETVAEYRVFTDSTGGNTIKAKFVDFKSGKAILEAEDGRTISLSMTKLSDGDQLYIRKILKAKLKAKK